MQNTAKKVMRKNAQFEEFQRTPNFWNHLLPSHEEITHFSTPYFLMLLQSTIHLFEKKKSIP